MAKHPEKKKIIILTGSELRHEFFRKYLASADQIEVLATYCEGKEKSLANLIGDEEDNESLRMAHLRNREQSEEDFFRAFVNTVSDHSNRFPYPKARSTRRLTIQILSKQLRIWSFVTALPSFGNRSWAPFRAVS